MTKEDLATLLDGRQRGHEISRAEEADVAAAGLVVVFGASDDLLELRGALSEETGAWDGTDVWLTPAGLFDTESCPDQCRWWRQAYEQARQHGVRLQAHWCQDLPDDADVSWSYSLAMPHATFLIYEEAVPYCRGIVFALADLPPHA